MSVENGMVISEIDLRSGMNYFADVPEIEVKEEIEEIECACGCGTLIDETNDKNYLMSTVYEELINPSVSCARRYAEMNKDLVCETKSK
ncbi:hypothetical protein [Fictibacillus sp. NRS-1165]|uniref:hypothetical protein n=1 Tax=Fictibacillus sp. NRS-1165 TaxID=3144463 RepID=UPI003D1BB6D6